MKVLVISHTYISPINRKKWIVLGALFPNVTLIIVFPTIWPSTIFNHVAGNLDAQCFENCKFIAVKAFKTGNEILYSYSPLKLIKIINSFRPDIIHVEQGDNALSYFQSILSSKILGLKSKLIFFTWINWRHKFSFKYRIFWKWIENFNLKYSNAAIAGNNNARLILQEKGLTKTVLVLPQLGVDTSLFYPAPKETNSEFIIGFAGRLIEEKGIFILLQAFLQLSEKYTNLRLIYLGNGRCKEELIFRAQQCDISHKVKVIEPVPHEQVAKFMQKLDIFVLPSFDLCDWHEQFGHVLIEAMACRVAVIGSDAGEISNVLEGAGLVFKQNNISSLHDVLEMLIKDKNLRNNIADKGYKKTLSLYSCEAIALHTYNFWNQVLQKGDSYE